jgi:hypothetical protein
MITLTSKTSIHLIKKLQVYCFNLFSRDAIDHVFSIMMTFILTCIGAMLIITFFFAMEKREMKNLPRLALENSSRNDACIKSNA